MPAARKQLILLGLVLLISTAVLFAGDKTSRSKHPDSSISPVVAPMEDNKRLVHALNRFTFGVRPSDIERVQAEGLNNWFDEQLHPEKIDDGAVESRLAPFRTLKMSTKEMVENFPPPQVLKAIENGRMSMPHDPAKKAVYESRMAAYQQREQNKEDKAAASNAGDNNAEKAASSEPAVVTVPVADDTDAAMEMSSGNKAPLTAGQSKHQKIREDAMYADLDTDRLLKLAPDERYKAILKMPVDERLDLAKTYKGPRAMQLVDDMKPEQREPVEAMIQPQAVLGELAEAKLLRAIYSNRQLDEVMTDFWFNHFNVFIGKGPDRYMVNAYEREVIRPHALGKFKDILAATAKSPAMLFYLDNWQSVGPDSELALYGPQRRGNRRGRFARPRPQQGKNRPSGLNENYAREIMELHTLGVDGGYTQKDVTELAKVLTGWTIEQPQMGGGFKFNERAHEPGPKYVLGRKIGEHGEKEGEEMLGVLARHPSTARFISRKLAMRFVSDNPPQALVDRMAETFLKKDGDIRDVLRTMFRSPEFWAADAYRAKMKTPFEFVASAVRASGADIQNALPLVGTLNRMGMPLYAMQPPTGYSMKAEAWVNSSALLNRMNFALQLASGKLPGTSLDPQGLIPGPAPVDSQAALAALEQSILAGDVSPQTHT
ncbi:MAG: hypothetical protein JWN42_1539, partial [Candidatus Angelobacter sp.]|nr:hypothetical protein [Candidatus Angelobacter sp.]